MILILIAVNIKTPTLAATSWWTVYGTLVDFGCLLTIYILLRREGLRIRDLLSLIKLKLAVICLSVSVLLL